jgi:hypothetical protein
MGILQVMDLTETWYPLRLRSLWSALVLRCVDQFSVFLKTIITQSCRLAAIGFRLFSSSPLSQQSAPYTTNELIAQNHHIIVEIYRTSQLYIRGTKNRQILPTFCEKH